MHVKFWCGSLRERDHLEDLGIDGMTILKWIFDEWDARTWTCIDLAQDRDM
jgi:hypothetical protein